MHNKNCKNRRIAIFLNKSISFIKSLYVRDACFTFVSWLLTQPQRYSYTEPPEIWDWAIVPHGTVVTGLNLWVSQERYWMHTQSLHRSPLGQLLDRWVIPRESLEWHESTKNKTDNEVFERRQCQQNSKRTWCKRHSLPTVAFLRIFADCGLFLPISPIAPREMPDHQDAMQAAVARAALIRTFLRQETDAQ